MAAGRPLADAAGARSGVAAPAPAASGAPPSNRAPDSCISGGYQLLSRHVDSLELSYPGSLRPGIAAHLAEAKALAQSRDDHDVARAQIVLAGELFAVQDKGYQRFKYVLAGNSFRLTLSDAGSGKMPLALCQIRNAALLASGPEACEARLRTVLREISDLAGDGTVSRIDLAADFTTSDDMEAWDRRAWVTRLRDKNKYADGERHSGWKLSGDAVAFGMYDKTLEVQKSGKAYMYDVWERAGHVPWETVWRVEARFWRAFLYRYGIRGLSDVLASIPGLWAHFLTETLRLTVPNPGDETRSRWPDHPLWGFLRGVDWGSSFVPLCRVPVTLGAPSDEYLGKQMASLVTSIMGRDGLAEADEAVPRLLAYARSWAGRDSPFTGLSPDEAMIERARVKGRKYGTMCNVPSGTDATALTRQAAERTYREASRGG